MIARNVYPGTVTEWHVLSIDPDDLPAEGEPILITIENVNGERRVWIDAYLKRLDTDDFCFCTTCVNEFGQPEETMVWYKVLAWAYPPDPFETF